MHALLLAAAALTLQPDQLAFRYQSNLEPWDSYDCKHEKADVGVYEWDVYCKVGRVVRRYGVHLAVDFYARTSRGTSAYEVLYWITDWTDTRKPVSDSTTLWVHNSRPENRATFFELSQGVQDDAASLRLEIDLTR